MPEAFRRAFGVMGAVVKAPVTDDDPGDIIGLMGRCVTSGPTTTREEALEAVKRLRFD